MLGEAWIQAFSDKIQALSQTWRGWEHGSGVAFVGDVCLCTKSDPCVGSGTLLG
jgi:hypothetical protein